MTKSILARLAKASGHLLCSMLIIAVCSAVTSAYGFDFNFKAMKKADFAALAMAVRENGFPCPSISKARKVNESKDGYSARITCLSDDRKKSWDIRISNLPHGPAQLSYWDAPEPAKTAPILPINLEITPHKEKIAGLEYSADGQTLFTVSKAESRLIAWQFAPVRPKAEFTLRSMSLSPNRRTLIGVGERIEVLDADEAKRLRSFAVPAFSVPLPLNALAINDQRTQFALCWDTEIVLYDGKTGKKTGSLWGLNGPVVRLDYTPDGRYLIASGYSNFVVWDVQRSSKLIERQKAVVFVYGETLGLAKDFKQREPVNFQKIKDSNIQFTIPNARFHGATADGVFATSNAAFNVVELRSVSSGEILKRVTLLERHDESDIGRISPDMKFWASSKRDFSISVTDVATGVVVESAGGAGESRRPARDRAIAYCEKAISAVEKTQIDALEPGMRGNRVSFEYVTASRRRGSCVFSVGSPTRNLTSIEINEVQITDSDLEAAQKAAEVELGVLAADQTGLKAPIDGPILACCGPGN